MSSRTLPSTPRPLIDLGLLGPGDDVARGELHRVRGIALEEAVAFGVEQVGAFAAGALGDQNPRWREGRRMELHHLHVLERDPDPQSLGHSVSGAGVGVGGAAVEPTRATGGEDHRLRPDRRQAAVDQVPGDHSLAAVLVLDELPDEELLVDLQVALHHLLEEDVHQHVAGDVGRVGRSRLARSAERALRDPSVLRAREDRPPVLELVDVAGSLVAEDLDRVLVAEVVRALDGVEGVLLRIVLRGVPESGVDAALGRTGMASNRMDLRDQRDVGARIVRFDGRPHSRAACPDNEHVVLRFHRERTLSKRRQAEAPNGCGDGRDWRRPQKS